MDHLNSAAQGNAHNNQQIANAVQQKQDEIKQIYKRAQQQQQAEAQQKNQAQALIDGHVQQIRHLEVTFTNITTVAKEQEAIAVHEINGPMELNVSSPLSNISMMVLGGFIAAAGIAAVALSFTLLNALTLGMPGLIVGSIGVAAALSGIGLFATGAYKNRTIISENTLNFSDELAVQ
jgi:hypothetical protein